MGTAPGPLHARSGVRALEHYDQARVGIADAPALGEDGELDSSLGTACTQIGWALRQLEMRGSQ